MNKEYQKTLKRQTERPTGTRDWVRVGPLNVYLRVAERFLPKATRTEVFLDIANIEVKDARAYLRAAWAIHELYEAAATLPMRTYVENVIEPKIAHYLYHNKNYVFIPNHADPGAICPCFVTKMVRVV